MEIESLKPIHVNDLEKRLFVSRPKENKSGILSSCNMTPDDVDYEMSFSKDKHILQISGMNQDSFEYFIENYGKDYEILHFFKCQLISDFSPLSCLKNLKTVRIDWNIRSRGLWNMSDNTKLSHIVINDSKIITCNLQNLNTGKTLKSISVYGDSFSPYPLSSLDVFGNLPQLEALNLDCLKIENRNTDFLKTLPRLSEFNFGPGMFTTEEIAYMCARYPHIHGTSLGAYSTAAATIYDVRVCGCRKPGINLPEGQKRLDKYILSFNALVEKYKTEELE